MKESQFIKQNKEKWAESEELLTSRQQDTDQLSTRFIQLVDDLSYARTFFSKRFITVYLNQNSMKFFSLIYKRKKNKWATFMNFWREELPQVVIHCRTELILALLIFLLSVTIGVVSSIYEPQFVSQILGERYVQMTKENIESGDPMAVYKKSSQGDMFLYITINNIYVSFITYLTGLLAGLGTIWALIFNGIMIGAFQYFFYERGLLGTSMLAIWLHGTLEISSIVIAGGAGLTLARGLIVPGTLSRMQSFYRSAARSLKLLLGTIPIFIFAAFVESFITRYTEIPDFIRLIFILISASFIIGYFIVYPFVKSRKGFNVPLQEVKLSPSRKDGVAYTSIKNNADIFTDTFYLYFKKFGVLATGLLVGAFAISLYVKLFVKPPDYGVETFWLLQLFIDAFDLFNSLELSTVLVKGLATGLLLFFINHIISSGATPETSTGIKYYLTGAINAMIVCLFIQWAVYATSAAGVVFLCLFLPFLLLLTFTAHQEQQFFILSLGTVFKILGRGFWQCMGLFVMLLISSALFAVLFNSPLIYLYLEHLQNAIDPELENLQAIMSFITHFISAFILLALLAFNCVALALLYFSSHEILTAENLKDRINQLRHPNPKHYAA